MKIKNSFTVLFLVFSLIISICCLPPNPSLEPSSLTVRYEIPDVRALEGYPELQEKDGISVSVVPKSFVKDEKFRIKCRWIGDVLDRTLGIKEEDFGWDQETEYQIFEVPYYEVKPENLVFNVKIYNHLERVLRLAGTIVAFQLDGKMINLERANYKEFLDGFIIPRQEQECEIRGPLINTLPNQCNVALLLYDIVTQTDEAGNVIKKSNFEWYFTYKTEVKVEAMIERDRGVYEMTKSEARAKEKRR